MVLFNLQWMSSPEKIREDLEEIKSELGSVGEKLKNLANEGNLHVGGISVLVFQDVEWIYVFWQTNLRRMTGFAIC